VGRRSGLDAAAKRKNPFSTEIRIGDLPSTWLPERIYDESQLLV
jgi:hypothetical protein